MEKSDSLIKENGQDIRKIETVLVKDSFPMEGRS